MKKLVTHGQGFHADDVMAYAILKEVLMKHGETWTISRGYDKNAIEEADIVFDTGAEYDVSRNRYDHHQKNRAGMRENGVLYASAGLIWKHFGKEICENENVWSQIDISIISAIDAMDNGQDVVKEYWFKDMKVTSVGNLFYLFEPSPFEEKTPEILTERFEQASEFAREILVRALHDFNEYEKAFLEAKKVYEAATDKTILIFQKNYERPTWRRLAEFSEPLFIVYYNNKNDDWKVEAVRKSVDTIESRKNAPISWRGLRDEELQKESKVSDAIFCHASGFLMVAKSFEGAMELAKKALLM